ncbi:L-lactate dehydrogenase [Anthocerotibacter panamensis]|uniref:L-lactate dehydrogenase n=1 Tax=Anthocerotibacter panamensis TaxID=2857077 RepID=UPI001C403925
MPLFTPFQQDRHKLRRGAIIGAAGHVGTACAYSLVIQNIFDELILVDPEQEKLEGEVMDLVHGLPFVAPTEIRAGTVMDCRSADIVIITAATKQRSSTGSRLDLAQYNAPLFDHLIPEIARSCPEAIYIVVSNPVDVLTHLTLQRSGLPPSRVIGTGTILDTARFRALLAQRLSLDPRSVHAYILGEHGDSAVPVWSAIHVAGVDLRRVHVPEEPDWLEGIFHQVQTAAYEIIRRKGSTCYAIGLGVTQIAQAILHNQNRVLTVSGLLQGQYGLEEVCLSLPSVINRQGIAGTINIPLCPDEHQQLRHSARILQQAFCLIGG